MNTVEPPVEPPVEAVVPAQPTDTPAFKYEIRATYDIVHRVDCPVAPERGALCHLSPELLVQQIETFHWLEACAVCKPV